MASDVLFYRFRQLAKSAVVLALCVVLLGAWVRLSDAGLGCPDWPGCYGTLTVPEASEAVAAANEAFPARPVESDKAWKEMVHRYLAGGLGLVVAALMVMGLVNRHHSRQPVLWPVLLAGLVIFQAILGMWTVTLQLKPVVVMGHLLGGFATLSLLWWLSISTSERFRYSTRSSGLSWLAGLGVILLIGQIALGGWTSSNYAALACPDFPQCQQQWWPKDMDFDEGFVLWRGLGQNYEFGVLEHPARTAIHLTHRLGALVVTAFLMLLAWWVFAREDNARVRHTMWAVLGLLTVQITLGISNVIFGLPLYVAVAHNGVAAMLLLAMILLTLSLARQSDDRYVVRG